MESNYKVVYTGQLRSGFEFEDALSNLIAITKMDRAKAEKFLSATKPTLIKKNLDKEQAIKYGTAFKKAGLEVKVFRPQPQKQAPKPQPRKPESPPPFPLQGLDPENPYASPQADLTVEKKQKGEWLDTPNKVVPSSGWQWIKFGAAMLLTDPWKWMGMISTVMAIMIVAQLIPIIGPITGIVVNLIFTGGVMWAAHTHAEEGTLNFADIFKGFTQNCAQLTLASAFYLIGIIGIFIIIGLLMFLAIGPEIISIAMEGSSSPDMSALFAEKMLFIVLAILLGTSLSIPLFMAIWFAAPLIILSDHTAWNALKLSFQACLKNWVAFLVYGLVYFVIGTIITVIFSIISGLLSLIMMSSSQILLFIFTLLFMATLIIPMSVIYYLSIYAGYRDIFYSSN